jgi:hypothetical protein
MTLLPNHPAACTLRLGLSLAELFGLPAEAGWAKLCGRGAAEVCRGADWLVSLAPCASRLARPRKSRVVALRASLSDCERWVRRK